MNRILLVLSFLFSFNSAFSDAPSLSDEATISVLTCSPGSELYSLFGHSAIRVHDPAKHIDVVFNYGTFSFDEDFYFNFAMGRLNYSLSIQAMDNFLLAYKADNRGVVEQVLRLDQEEKQKVVDYLDWNHLPENREYLYDFFYDNCSSRLRFVLEQALPEADLEFAELQYQSEPSFRDMIDAYLIYHPWGDFGIDLGLGLPCDKIPSSDEYVFLPDELERAFDQAKLDGAPLVIRKNNLIEGQPLRASFSLFDPTPLMWLLFGLVLVFTTLGWRRKKLWWGIDMVLFLVIGAVGLLVAFLWFVTDHTATANNLNILWAWPTHLIAIFFILIPTVRRYYMMAYGLVLALTLLSFGLLPQGLHIATMPLMMIGIVRALLYWRIGRV